jgi:hypothetical protein
VAKKCLVFIPIAERDVDFYLNTADELKKTSPDFEKFCFISFYQPRNAEIIKRGYQVFDFYKHLDENFGNTQADWLRAEKDFQLQNLHKLILHEKLTFGQTDDEQVYGKFSRYLKASDEILKKIKAENPELDCIILQELGGFIGPLSVYFASAKNNLLHYFTEPAFFKGRIHLNKNSLNTEIKASNYSQEEHEQVQAYVQKAWQQKTIVAAKKDHHHYLDMGLKKIFNPYNILKFSKKLKYKYIDGQKQEFEHVYNHTKRYLKMFLTRKKNSSSYTESVNELKKHTYFYFPFHVQLDYSLTVRSPEYLDQLGLIEKILQILPMGVCLAVKEHPASIGCLDYARTQKLLENKNLFFMHPSLNSYDLIRDACGVVTINSKVGAEALTLGKKVFTFGNCFYSNSGLVQKFTTWLDFESFLIQNSRPDREPQNIEAVVQFLTRVWNQSFPTELYDNNPANIKNFSQAISKTLTP